MLDAAISRRFLICSYGPEYMGLVTGAMEAAGCSCDFVYRPRGRKKRYPDSFDPMRHHALVILGDDQQHADHSRYEPEKDWVRAAIEQGSAVLGICHGAQLLSWPSCRTEESSVLRMVGTILMRDSRACHDQRWSRGLHLATHPGRCVDVPGSWRHFRTSTWCHESS